MSRNCTENILRVIQLGRQLVSIADKGDDEREDDSCGVLFGIARDAGYRILILAEEERGRHLQKGSWDREAEKEVRRKAEANLEGGERNDSV